MGPQFLQPHPNRYTKLLHHLVKGPEIPNSGLYSVLKAVYINSRRVIINKGPGMRFNIATILEMVPDPISFWLVQIKTCYLNAIVCVLSSEDGWRDHILNQYGLSDV